MGNFFRECLFPADFHGWIVLSSLSGAKLELGWSLLTFFFLGGMIRSWVRSRNSFNVEAIGCTEKKVEDNFFYCIALIIEGIMLYRVIDGYERGLD